MILYMSYPSRFIRLFGEMFSKYFCTHSLKRMIKRNSIEMKCIPMKRFEIIGIKGIIISKFLIFRTLFQGKCFVKSSRTNNNIINEMKIMN